jgi:hypothetical protein
MKEKFKDLDKCITIIREVFGNLRILIESVIGPATHYDDDPDYYIEMTLYPSKFLGDISKEEFRKKSLKVYSILRQKGYRDICEKVVIRKGWSSYEDKISL